MTDQFDDWLKAHVKPKPDPRLEGMPGTFSHCDRNGTHEAHRHTITLQEGPVPNVLCKGTPGELDADAPYGRTVTYYESW